MGKITLLILKISGCFILINIVLFCLYTPEESLGGGYNYNSECRHISGTQIDIPPHVTNFITTNGWHIIEYSCQVGTIHI